MSTITEVESAYHQIPFDSTSIDQRSLDVEGRRRVNALPWRGQFTPEFLEVLLSEYASDGLVVDPYCGSGTTLMEAAHAGLPSHGVEVNPAAYILSDLYSLCGIRPIERLRLVQAIGHALFESTKLTSSSERLAEWIRDLSEPNHRRVAEAVFLLSLKNGSVIDDVSMKKALDQVEGLVRRLPQDEVGITVELGDARSIALASGTAGTIITSPPYVNVFNYHQNYRKAVELLGCDVLPAARAEFGSNRKHRQNRFLTVIQYAQDIGLSLLETSRISRPDATSVWVVGRESNVRGVPIRNPQIVFEMATQAAGLEMINKHERKFRSRYGALVYEDVLVFKRSARHTAISADEVASLGRKVGIGVLGQLRTDDASIADEIELAASSAGRVLPSVSPDHASFRKRDKWRD